MDRQSQLIAQNYARNTGRLPEYNDRAQTIQGRPQRVRVLRSEFYFRGSVPKVGDLITLPLEDARGLQFRGFVELAS